MMFSSKFFLLVLAFVALCTLSVQGATTVDTVDAAEIDLERFLMEDGNHTAHEDECHCDGDHVHCEHEEDEAFCHCEDGEVHCDEEDHDSHDDKDHDSHDDHDDHMCHCDGDEVHCLGEDWETLETKCHCEDGEVHCDEEAKSTSGASSFSCVLGSTAAAALTAAAAAL
mmetsp:Transcript_18353/g.42137  ORF Transcript_18353/g.42137 Transcript_18353/m.42137 type:complete len:169 (+) Transcript_18353:620-1126(+)